MRPPNAASAPAPRSWLAVIPGAGLAALAKFTCSLCLAVYAGVLSSLGLGFVATERGFLALTVLLLTFGAASVFWSVRRHHRWSPLVLSVLGAVAVVFGRVKLDTTAVYAGTVIVAVAALWNLWLGLRPRPPLVPLVSSRASNGGSDNA